MSSPVKVNIKFIDGEGTISSYTATDEANTSRLAKLAIPSSGEKLFYLSQTPYAVTSPLDGQHKWFDETVGYSGFVSNTVTDENGEFKSIETEEQPLPTGYTQLESIEFTGEQVIDTGINILSCVHPESGHFYPKIETKLQFIRGANGHFSKYAIGVANSLGSGTSIRDLFTFGIHNGGYVTNQYWYMNVNNNSISSTLLTEEEACKVHTFSMFKTGGEYRFTVDNEVKMSFIYAYSLPASGNIIIGGKRASVITDTYAYKCRMRLYNFIITAYGRDTPLFEGVPAKRDSDGVLGVYDLISNTFKSSQTETPLENKTCPELTITGEGIKELVLHSDILDNNMTMKVEANGTVFENAGYALPIVFSTSQSKVVIKFMQLNAPYQPVAITSAGVNLVVSFTDEKIISYDFGAQSQGTPETAEYSVISRYGSIELDNSDKLFTKLSNLDLLDQRMPCEVYIKNKSFGEYILQDGDLQFGSTSVKFDLTDKLIDYDQVRWVKNTYSQSNVTATTFLNYIFTLLGQTWSAYDTKTQEVLNATTFSNSILDDTDVKSVLNEILLATQCTLFVANNKAVKVKYLERQYSEVI